MLCSCGGEICTALHPVVPRQGCNPAQGSPPAHAPMNDTQAVADVRAYGDNLHRRSVKVGHDDADRGVGGRRPHLLPAAAAARAGQQHQPKGQEAESTVHASLPDKTQPPLESWGLIPGEAGLLLRISSPYSAACSGWRSARLTESGTG